MHLYCNINLKIDILYSAFTLYIKRREEEEIIREKEKKRNNFLINIKFNNK